MTSEQPAHLAPSELGTKEYWDALYATELANHAHNPADTGTVWFDDSDAEAKMVAFLEDENLAGPGQNILDLGCGNGSLLRAVRDEFGEQWQEEEENGDENKNRKATRLLGVDYSEASVSLAKSIAEAEGDDEVKDKEDKIPVEFAVWDILHGNAADLGIQAGQWDLVLDKGTFDAISLGHSQASAGDSSIETLYRQQVLRLLRPETGRFLITSCNWTEPELCAWMENKAGNGDADGNNAFVLEKAGRVEYPSFQFGGVQGQTVCTVCFAKKGKP